MQFDDSFIKYNIGCTIWKGIESIVKTCAMSKLRPFLPSPKYNIKPSGALFNGPYVAFCDI